MRLSSLATVLAVVPLSLWAGVNAQNAAPDLILVGGKVFTATDSAPWATAVAIRGERIIAVGAEQEIRALAGRSTRVQELGGRVVVPGFNDAHMHVSPRRGGTYVAFAEMDPPLRAVLDSITAVATRVPAGEWIRADVGARVLDDSEVNRASLDRVAPRHPVVLAGWTGHDGVLNTAALRAMAISESEPDPPDGWWDRDPATRRLTGRVHGYAWFDIGNRRVAAVPDSLAAAAIEATAAEATHFGITSIQDMTIPLDAARAARLVARLDLPIRLRIIPFGNPAALDRAPESRPVAARDRVSVSGSKWIVDGTPVERLAFLRRPYADRRGCDRKSVV